MTSMSLGLKLSTFGAMEVEDDVLLPEMLGYYQASVKMKCWVIIKFLLRCWKPFCYASDLKCVKFFGITQDCHQSIGCREPWSLLCSGMVCKWVFHCVGWLDRNKLCVYEVRWVYGVYIDVPWWFSEQNQNFYILVCRNLYFLFLFLWTFST